jgi:hypothetical protein
VEFRTHWLNQQSRAAIARLGAKQDGVLRSHQRMPDGTLRDTVVFSIIALEWPGVRNELRRRLSAHRRGPRQDPGYPASHRVYTTDALRRQKRTMLRGCEPKWGL